MKIQCEYCGNYIDDSDEKCFHCGAINKGIKRTGNGVPRTIEELKQWYIDHNLPDENSTRFFIGKDYAGPKAYGIYQDQNTGDFIVYKNKADGSRATRYSGKDEAYAVNELYTKLKEQINIQKSRNSGYNYNNGTNTSRSSYSSNSNYKPPTFKAWHIVLIVVIIILLSSFTFRGRSYNYGGYNNSYYSSYDNDYNSNYYSYDYDDEDDSSWWSSSDWDSDSSWDSSSSWDSDWGSDWDSDW